MKRLSIRLLTILALLLLLTTQVAHAQDNREIMRLGRGAATSLDWRPDGKVLAVGSSSGVWFFDDQFEQLGNIDTRAIEHVVWSPDGEKLLISADDKKAEVWSINSSLSISKRFTLSKGEFYTWSPDNKLIAIFNSDDQGKNGILEIVSAQIGGRINSIEGLSYQQPSWSPDSQALAVQTDDRTMNVIDAETGKTKATYEMSGIDDHISAFAFEQTGEQLEILNEWDTKLYIWNIATNQITNKSFTDSSDCLPTSMRVLKHETAFICYSFGGGYGTLNLLSNQTPPLRGTGLLDSILSYDWQPNTTLMTVLFNKGIIQTWDIQSDNTENRQLFLQAQAIVWSPDSQYLAVSSARYGEDWAYPVSAWSINKSQGAAWIPQPEFTFYPESSTKWIAWKDPSTLLAYSDNQTFPTALCFIYALEGRDVIKKQKANFGYDDGVCGIDDLPTNWKYVVEWSKDFKWVAYVEGDHINIAPNTPYETTQYSLKPNVSVESISWSPDNSRLIVKGLDSTTNETSIEVWDIKSETLLKMLNLSSDEAEPFWSPDGKRFAITTHSDISVFDRNGDLEFIHHFKLLPTLLSWSPDSQKLAIAVGTANLNTIQIIDPTSNKIWFSFESNSTSLDWSPDSNYLIYPIYPAKVVVIADAKTGTELKRLKSEPIDNIKLSPDGKMLALGMEDGTIRIWDVSDLL